MSVVCLRRCCKLFTFSYSSPSTWPISTKIDTKHHWVKWIQVCSMSQVLVIFKGEIILILKNKKGEIILIKKNKKPLKNYKARKPQICMEASSDTVDLR